MIRTLVAFVLCSQGAVGQAILGQLQQSPIGKVSLLVVDEDGNPMADVPVSVSMSTILEANTDISGKALFESATNGAIGAGASQRGFYQSSENIDFHEQKNGQWLPWPKEKKIILRKIGNPVPLFAAEGMETEMPKIGTAAFDLEKRDWVAPHGRGVVSDLVFTLTRQGDETRGEATLRLSFSHPGDGFVPIYELNPGGSQLRFPREAPETGYQPWREWQWKWENGESREELAEGGKIFQEFLKQRAKVAPPVGYFLRLRTALDKQGAVVSARYARLVCDPYKTERMCGDIVWAPEYHTKTTMMKLTYYFNPTGSRNLEFDLKKNLFKDLPDANKPRWP